MASTSNDAWSAPADRPGRGSGCRALQELAPAAASSFHRLIATTAASPEVTALLRSTCSETIALPALPHLDGPNGEPPRHTGPVFEFARQFATDVSAIGEVQRSEFTAACGAGAFGVVQSLWVADMAPRAMAVLDALFGAAPSDEAGSWLDDAPVEVDAMSSWAGVEEFLTVVHQLTALDPVTTEIVRLRGARHHDCRLCRSLRSRPALQAGATEDLFDSIDTAGQPALTSRQRTAVALTDAMVWHPAHLDEALLGDVRAAFTPMEAVELVLDIMRNASNKIAVALAADAPHVTEGVEIYEIDHDGTAHYGLVM